MRTERELVIDLEAETRKIVTFISHTVKGLGKKGAVLGLSGGLDSAMVAHLCVRALSPKRVLGLLLPERDSDPRQTEDARRVVKELGIKSEEIELTPTLSALEAYRSIPRWATRPWLVRRVYKRFKHKAGVSYLIHSLARPYRGEGITAVICSLCRISASLTNSLHKPICATVSRRTGKRNVGQSCMT